MRKIRRILLFSLLFFLVMAGAQPATAGYYPRSMAALGDSITQATNVCCVPGDYPAQSWSTGDGGADGIRTHYERLLRLQPALRGNAFNNSVSGARVSDLPRQAAVAASQRAGYVTILMGANDLCTPSLQTMTPVADFRAKVYESLAVLNQMRPRPQVFISSIPNIYQLWSVLHTDPAAQQVWSSFAICQSMLSPANTDAMRQEVAQREVAFNAILARACDHFGRICRHDDGAVYNHSFTAADVGTLDYFHPSARGQAKLADITWRAAW